MTYVEIKKYSTTYLYNKDNLPFVAVNDITGLPYYLKINQKEIYPDGPVILNQQYATDENKLPYYPKDTAGKEIYIKDADKSKIYIYRNKSPVYALNQGKPYYATDIEGSEFYPIDENNNEIYIIINEKQIYAQTVDKHEIYAKKIKPDGSFSEVYALHRKIPYYASTPEGEFYAVDENEYYITVDGKQIYAKYTHGGQRYAFQTAADGNASQYYALDRGVAYYAIDYKKSQYYADDKYIEIDRKQIYAKDVDNNEHYANFMTIEVFARDNGEPYYAKYKNEAEFYPRKKGVPYYVHNDERALYARNEKMSQFYINVNGKEIYGENVKNKNQLYALDADLHQYYATDRGKPYFAKLGNGGDPYYPQNSKGQDFYFAFARDRNGNIIYPNRDIVMFVKNPTVIVTYLDFLKNIKRPSRSLGIIALIIIVAIFGIFFIFLFKSRKP